MNLLSFHWMFFFSLSLSINLLFVLIRPSPLHAMWMRMWAIFGWKNQISMYRFKQFHWQTDCVVCHFHLEFHLNPFSVNILEVYSSVSQQININFDSWKVVNPLLSRYTRARTHEWMRGTRFIQMMEFLGRWFNFKWFYMLIYHPSGFSSFVCFFSSLFFRRQALMCF